MDTLGLKENVNTGVLLRSPNALDFIAGDDNGFSFVSRLPSANWRQYIPNDEAQSGVYFDTMACVTFSALNSVETQIDFMVANGLIPTVVLDELKVMGYFDENGKFNASDRFTAKMSGTTRNGNYLTKVWDSIRNDGVLPEKDWNYPREQRSPVFVWEDYYIEIPQALKDKAKRFKELFKVSYQWLVPGSLANKATFKHWLQMAPIQLATAVCSPWNTSKVVQGCNLAVGHATMMFCANESWYDIEDHYKPFQKRLALDYPIPNALIGVISLKDSTTPSMPNIDPTFGKRLSGKLLLAVEEHGDLYYVTPDGKKARIGRTPEDVANFQKAINDKRIPVLGISSADLSKIASV